MMNEETWKESMRSIIEDNWNIEEQFTLAQVYTSTDYLSQLHPENKNVKEKIRQTLQYLRNDGYIEFIDNEGNYRRLR